MSADLTKMIQERIIELEETLVTAESCTGGMIGARLTELSGSSKYYLGGAVVYSNELKLLLLGVPPAKLTRFGAVSKPVAKAMAQGAQRNFGSDWAVAVTGIAGPKSDDTEKPVGLVYIAVAGPGDVVKVEKKRFDGGRAEVRQQTVERALGLLWEMIQ